MFPVNPTYMLTTKKQLISNYSLLTKTFVFGCIIRLKRVYFTAVSKAWHETPLPCITRFLMHHAPGHKCTYKAVKAPTLLRTNKLLVEAQNSCYGANFGVSELPSIVVSLG